MADIRWLTVAAPVGTLVLGWALSQLGDERKERRQAQREQAALLAEQANDLAERRGAFQRETLLALQDAMADLIRATARIHYEDRMVHKTESAAWGQANVSEEWSERHLNGRIVTNKLVARVEDDELRALVSAVVALCEEVATAASQEESLELLTGAMEAHEVATDRIGVLLRTVY